MSHHQPPPFGGYPPPSGPPPGSPPGLSPRRIYSGGLLFLFSCFLPPGANYMYMGLIKRGLAAMCGFFLLIFMMISASILPITLLFAFSLPIFALTCIFDGFSILRRINNGEYVEDGIGSILNSILANRTLTMIILAIIVISFAGAFLGFAINLIRSLLPLALVIFGIYVILRRKKNTSPPHEH